MRKTNRLLAVLLSVIMVMSMMSAAAFAQGDGDKVRVIVENTTYTDDSAPWTGVLVDEWIDIDGDSTMMGCVAEALKANGYSQKGAESNYISEINGIAAFDGGYTSGWTGTLNDWFTNEGFGAFTVANGNLGDGDEIRIMYTMNYGGDLGGSWDNTDKTVKALSFSDGTLSPEFCGDVHSYTLTVPSDVSGVTVTSTATNKNYQVRTSVNGTEYKRTAVVPVADGTVITVKCGDPAWPTMNGGSGEAQVYTVTVQYETPSFDEVYKAVGDYIATLGTPGVGSVGGEWMVIGLARSDRDVADGYYDAVVKYVNENISDKEQLHRAKSTDNSRVILALTALGYDVTNVDGHNLLVGLSDMSYIKRQGINGPIWALIAFDSHNYEIPEGNVTRDALIEAILGAELAEGGWALSGSKADPDMTAMAIQSLANYYTDEKVKTAVDKALECLSSLQEESGGYLSWGTTNSESCAQVIVALTALGFDPQTDSRFVKNGRSVVDALLAFYTEGGFRHGMNGTLNGMTTEQGYYALVSYARLKENKTSLYDMSDVTIRKEEEPDVSDDSSDEPTVSGDLSEEPTESSEDDTSSEPNGESSAPSSPTTGDSANVVIYFGLMMLSLVGITAAAASKRNSKHE